MTGERRWRVNPHRYLVGDQVAECLTHRGRLNVMPTEVGIHDFACCDKGKA